MYTDTCEADNEVFRCFSDAHARLTCHSASARVLYVGAVHSPKQLSLVYLATP